jgi:hypothetical protein
MTREESGVILPALYHWSPADRYDDVLRHGLVPHSPAAIASAPMPHVCLSPTPSRAWSLSGGTGWYEADGWDLWQVRLNEHDEVHVRPIYGDVLEEINVRNVITPDRVWWVARRTMP